MGAAAENGMFQTTQRITIISSRSSSSSSSSDDRWTD